MAQVIGQAKRDPADAHVAIDFYFVSIPMRAEAHDRFQAAIRALDLAGLLSDATRLTQSRNALMDLHRAAIKAGTQQWWYAIDRLIDDKKTGVTDAERAELVADLEALVVRYADENNTAWHDPNSTRDAADRLIQHYRRTQRPADIKRLHAVVARAFEHAASLGNAMLAAAFLQTAMDRFRDAGMSGDSRRICIAMQTKIGEANAEMVPIGTEIKISFDDMEKFIDALITDEIGSSLVRIAREFLLKRKNLEEAVQTTLEKAPLMAHITQHIMADDFVAAKIGSVEEDPFGRLFDQAKLSFGFSGVWLHEAFARLLEKHDVLPEHIAGWANRHAVFEDMALLLEGVRAWFQNDFVKATHLLIPQVEVAMRSIADQLGVPVTRADPKVAGTSVAVGMGDILYNTKVTHALGPDITLHLQAAFADPRGLNLRNEMAHGLLALPRSTATLHGSLFTSFSCSACGRELAKRRQ